MWEIYRTGSLDLSWPDLLQSFYLWLISFPPCLLCSKYFHSLSVSMLGMKIVRMPNCLTIQISRSANTAAHTGIWGKAETDCWAEKGPKTHRTQARSSSGLGTLSDLAYRIFLVWLDCCVCVNSPNLLIKAYLKPPPIIPCHLQSYINVWRAIRNPFTC
jgi:hypothetical protein